MPEVIQSRDKLLKKRGSGGTGDVFQAYDLRLKRMVALKKARDGTPEERQRRSRRLIREAFRAVFSELPDALDIVVIVRRPLGERKMPAIAAEWQRALPRLRRAAEG